MVRSVRCPGGEVHEERTVGHQSLLLADPADGVVGEVLGEVVALLGRRGRLDGRRPVVQRRLVLVVLAADEAVERLEAATGRGPCVERAHRRRLPHRHLVALAELGGRVAVQLQRHRQRRLRVRPHRAVARRRRRGLGDAAHPDRVVVAAGEHRLASRRTQRGRVEAVVAEAGRREPFSVRRVAGSPECRRGAEPDVVEQHDQHVRRAVWRQQRFDRRVRRVGVLRVVGRQSRRRTIRDRQHRAGMAIGTVGHEDSSGQNGFLQNLGHVDPSRHRPERANVVAADARTHRPLKRAGRLSRKAVRPSSASELAHAAVRAVSNSSSGPGSATARSKPSL